MPDRQPTRPLIETGAGNVAGIGLILIGYVVITAGDAAAIWVLPTIGIAGTLIARAVFGSLTLLVLNRNASLWPMRPGLVALRCVLHALVSVAWYWAWQKLSLADSYAIGFCAPLMMTLLAVPMLGEKLRWRRMVSTAVGFLGVLVIVRPGGELFVPEAGVLLAATVLLAVSRILTRTLSRTETAERMTFWLMAAHLPAGLVALLIFPGPSMPDAIGWIACVLLGVLNGVAHWLMARAFALAPVGVLAPFEYSTLLFGIVLGLVLFGTVPAWTTLAGAAVVACAGLYNLHRERVRRQEEQP